MSTIQIGMDTDKVERDITKAYIVKLTDKIAELEKDCADLQECFDTCYDELGATRDAHDVLEGEAVIAMKQHYDLCWKIEEIEESVRVDHAIASDYAMALFNRYYKDIADSIPLELCSTSGGVVTQIDNMVAGVMLDMAEEISELEKGYEELRMATLWAVQLMSGGQAKADLRDAYDKATEQLEALKETK
jgi:tetrahydromethanopterin S-methyltransferase subunit B